MDAPDQSVLNALSALVAALLIAGIVGAIVDRRYKKNGGLRPTKKHKTYLGAAGLLCIAFRA
jgi:hypothetical protein